jgi:hypothetical protein
VPPLGVLPALALAVLHNCEAEFVVSKSMPISFAAISPFSLILIRSGAFRCAQVGATRQPIDTSRRLLALTAVNSTYPEARRTADLQAVKPTRDH